MSIAPDGLSPGELDHRTPTDRNRYVDLLRVAAITMVVVGHWLAVVVTAEGGELQATSIQSELAWTHWFTWVFQVMPVFFLVGGFANAASWSSHRRRGGDWASWVHRRAARLLWPTTIFVAVAVVGVLVARGLGARATLISVAGSFATIALWFLAVYLGVAALAPPMLAAHERWGWRVPAAMVVTVAVVDLLRMGGEVGWVGNLNYALVWGTAHQLGFMWWDGSLTRTRRGLGALAATAGGALVALTVLGPYPISMVTVPGAGGQNTAPPSLALLALAFTQAGLFLLARRPARRWLQGPRVWAAVARGNAVVMSLFLWHVVAVIVAVPLLHLTGLFPQPPVGSGAWLWLRAGWVAALAVVLAPVLVVTGRWERPPDVLEPAPGRGHSHRAAALAAVGVAAACWGLALLTLGGLVEPDQPLMLPVDALVGYGLGLGLLAVAGHEARWPTAGG